jgi:hypothetical protein
MPIAPRETLPHGQVDGQRETDAFEIAAAADDHGVDADYFAVDIEQRASAIAAVDGGVGLEEALQLMVALAEVPALSADDAGGHGLVESEGRADGDRPVADFNGVGVADVDRRELLAGVDLQDCEIQLGVGADQLGGVLRLVAGQRHLNADGVLDDVVVGQDVAVVVHDKAGAQALRAPRMLWHVRDHIAKRSPVAKRILTVGWLPVEHKLSVRALFLDGADDLHDGRFGFLGDFGERVG